MRTPSPALQDAELRLQAAPDDDARLLADWLEAGEKGTRPDLTLDVYTHSMAPDEIAPETFLRLLTGRR